MPLPLVFAFAFAFSLFLWRPGPIGLRKAYDLRPKEGLWPKTYTSIHIDTHVYKSTYTVSRGKVRPSPGPGP